MEEEKRGFSQEEIDHFCEELKRFNSPLVYDALFFKYGLRNQILRKEVKPVLRDMKMAGPALTVRGNVKAVSLDEEFDRAGRGPLGGMWVRVADMVEEHPNCIVCVQPGYTEVSVLGDILGMTWKYAGMQGLVCDGPVRDTQGFLEENIPVFCTDTFPICAEGHWQMLEGNEPLWMHGQLGEVLVNPGDFIFGDSDAVLIIPKEYVEGVIEDCLKRAGNETVTKKSIREGMKARELWGRDGHGGQIG